MPWASSAARSRAAKRVCRDIFLRGAFLKPTGRAGGRQGQLRECACRHDADCAARRVAWGTNPQALRRRPQRCSWGRAGRRGGVARRWTAKEPCLVRTAPPYRAPRPCALLNCRDFASQTVQGTLWVGMGVRVEAPCNKQRLKPTSGPYIHTSQVRRLV